jgi:hypothetical protein
LHAFFKTFKSIMVADPGLYLDEYVDALFQKFYVSISISSMHRVLQYLSTAHKVMYRVSARAEPYLEGAFMNDVAADQRRLFVWGDECGTDRNAICHR